MFKHVIAVLLVVGWQLAFSQDTEHQPVTIIAAGVPKPFGESETFGPIFHTLSRAGISAFFPTFQYQEIPEAKTLGLEALFLPPCQNRNLALTALLGEGLRLIVPGELLYPQLPEPLPPLESDPLQALSACLGEAGIFAVYSCDEPVSQGVSLESVQRFYERVKTINPQLPVMMIHKPLLADDEMLQTPEQKAAYSGAVKRYSQYADVVGFDVYPIPPSTARVVSPYTSDPTTTYQRLLEDYLTWLHTELPDKQPALVLQGFSYTHLYEDGLLEKTYPADYLAAIRAPNQEELREMVRIGLEHNALIIWWGQSFLEKTDLQVWEDILTVSQEITKK
jgi:hypothetical protein